jgi:hypothetical protein
MTPAGIRRPSGRGQEHRGEYYHTRFHATHVNSAVVYGNDDRFVLALLFHQGQLLRIDRALPIGRQRGEVIMDGLMRPHSLGRTPTGWLFANSVGGGLVMLDEQLHVSGTIPYAEGWIQACTRLSDGRILLNDVDNHKIVEFPDGSQTISRIVEYDTEWRMAEMVQVPRPLEYWQGYCSAHFKGAAAQACYAAGPQSEAAKQGFCFARFG